MGIIGEDMRVHEVNENIVRDMEARRKKIRVGDTAYVEWRRR